jgi:two-component system CheB/CheR fusion protein
MGQAFCDSRWILRAEARGHWCLFVNIVGRARGLPAAHQAAYDARVLKTRHSPSDAAIAVVAHELRQPLSILQMYAHLLRRLPPSASAAQVHDIAEAMQTAIGSQRRIINDLLEISRVRADKLVLQRSELDLRELVSGHVIACSERWPGGRLRLEACGSLVCQADPVRVGQIVVNLLENAIKFSPAGSEVVVRLAAEHGFARLSVSDSGCGIAPEFLPHVFGMFHQGDCKEAPRKAQPGDAGGLGIGLALVHGLAVAHGGFVKATSAGIDLGAEFTVWLPLPGCPAQLRAVPCVSRL